MTAAVGSWKRCGVVGVGGVLVGYRQNNAGKVVVARLIGPQIERNPSSESEVFAQYRVGCGSSVE
jgi:hypothetical protein